MPTDRYFRRQSRLASEGRLTWVVRILAVITVGVLLITLLGEAAG
jgi:hypothetical protein